ncbi:unnamed protein product [Echinostoma caproni]|uniref:DUF1741 domain-containing protein n=1 Tax=Echinostoma caproni TaxID=27848 RepID=A0A183ASH7_9TREM|nr:unnamed protein product [Echinostoma caproni]
MPARLLNQATWNLLHRPSSALKSYPDQMLRTAYFHSSNAVLWTLLLDSFNTLLLHSSISTTSAHSVELTGALNLYLMLFGEANFDPSNFCSPDSSNFVLNEAVLEHILNEIGFSNDLPDSLESPKSHVFKLVPLVLRVVAAVCCKSPSACCYLLNSSKFLRFFDALLQRPDLQSVTSGPVCVRAMRVLLTCFAFAPIETNTDGIHPFDLFCVDRVIRFLGPPHVPGSRDSNETLSYESTPPQSSTLGLIELQDLFIRITCNRLVPTPENPACDESTTARPSVIAHCAPHTMHALDQTVRCEVALRALNYLHYHLVQLNILCKDPLARLFSATPATPIDELYDWLQLHCTSESGDQIRTHQDCQTHVPRTKCCMFIDAPSVHPSSESRDPNPQIDRLVGLSRLFYEFLHSLEPEHILPSSLGRHFMVSLMDLVWLSHAPQSVCRMITMASLAGGWVTLNRFANQLLDGIRPQTIMDWLVCSLHLLLMKHDPARRWFLRKLGDSESSTPLPCLLLLLLAYCHIETAGQSDRLIESAIDSFLNQSELDPVMLTAAVQKLNTSPIERGSGASELGQVFTTPPVLCTPQSNARLPVSPLTLSVPAGMSGPLAAFGEAAVEHWQRICKLPHPPPVSPSVCCDVFSDKSHSVIRGRLLKDFAPLAWFYAGETEHDLSSWRPLVAQSGASVPHKGSFPKPDCQQTATVELTESCSADLDRPNSESRPQLICDSSNLGCAGSAVNLTIRLPCLVWLQRIELFSFTIHERYQGPSAVLVDFYRELPRSPNQALVGVFTQAGFEPACQSFSNDAVPLTTSSPVGRRPDHAVLEFQPCLTNRLVIRLQHSLERGKSLALRKLRLLGYHINDGDWNEERLISLKALPTPSEFTRMSSSIALLHVIHNHVILSTVPKSAIVPTLVDRLLWPLLSVSMQPYRIAEMNRIASLLACDVGSQSSTFSDLVRIIGSVTASQDTVSNQTPGPKLIANWLEPLDSKCDGTRDSSICWTQSSFAAVLAERVLIRLMAACTIQPLVLLDYVLARLLFDDEFINLVQFAADFQLATDSLDTTSQSVEIMCSQLQTTASTTSSTSQRLLAFLCLHTDSGQSARLRCVLRWVGRVCSLYTEGSKLANPQVFYTTEMLHVLSGVLWNLGNSSPVLGAPDWRKELTVELVRRVHLACVHTWVRVQTQQHSSIELHSFAMSLSQVLCAMCTLHPELGLDLLVDLISNRCHVDQVPDEVEFAQQLRVITFVMQSQPVIDRLISSATQSTELSKTVDCLTECCDWLNSYFRDQLPGCTASHSTVMAVRRLQVITRLLEPERPEPLRKYLSQVVSEKLLLTLFNHCANEADAITILTSIYSTKLSSCSNTPVKTFTAFRDQFRSIVIDLFQALSFPLRTPDPNDPQRRMASLIRDKLRHIVENRGG